MDSDSSFWNIPRSQLFYQISMKIWLSGFYVRKTSTHYSFYSKDVIKNSRI